MSELKLARWRFSLIMFLFLTLAGVVFDCLYKMPRGDAMLLLLRNAVLPAVLTVVLYVIDWADKK
jgi:hypothetical protein